MPVCVNRRAFVQLAAAGLAAGVSSLRLPMNHPVMPAAAVVHHLLLGVADVNAGIEWVERRHADDAEGAARAQVEGGLAHRPHP